MTTALELKTKVLYRLGLPTTDAMMASADLLESINNGIAAMSADYDWPWLYETFEADTAAGNSILTTPDLKQRILWVARGDELLASRSVPDMLRYKTKTGTPIFWSVEGDIVHVHPVPDAVYTCTTGYINMPIPLVGDTDDVSPAIPAMYIPLAVIYACLEHATRLKDGERMNMLAAERDRWLKRTRDNARMSAVPGRIRARQDWFVS